MQPIVIVGSGLAGYTLLKEIRKRDADRPLTLITADDGAFYSKPMLSTALTAGKSARELATADAAQLADTLQARVLTHTRVTAIDSAARRVYAEGHDPDGIAYDALVLALGADPIGHGLVGDAAPAVFQVNDLADYALFRRALVAQPRVVVLGGGLIGCEFANDLAQTGVRVDVVHRGSWPLERLLPEAAGRELEQGLSRLGVRWHFGRMATRVDAAGAAQCVTLDNADTLEADLVLSAIGLRPRTALAAAAGIGVGRGIVTTAMLATGVDRIYALGDCAEVDGLNLPFIQPLMLQARALAATLTGTPTPVIYPPMPVLVKTSAHPISVLPPAAGILGEWAIEHGEAGVCATHRDAAGRLCGFALTGSEVGRRATLVKALGAAPLSA